MKLRFLIILTSSLLFVGAGAVNQGSEDGNSKEGSKKVETCAACHGKEGNSLVGLWPSLAGQNAKYLFKQLRLFKSGERENASMAGFLDELSDEDLKDIAAFYASKKNTIGQTEKDQVGLGRKLYYAGNIQKGVPACSACHSPRGLGNGPAAYPLLSGQQPDYVKKALKDYRSGERSNEDPSKIMVAIAYKLDDSEIEALSSFVHGLH